MSWSGLVSGGVDVHWMPGLHREMMHGANARGFARKLQECIERARARLESSPGQLSFARAADRLDSPLKEPDSGNIGLEASRAATAGQV